MYRLAAIMISAVAVASAQDLSRYRAFQFGEDLAAVAKQAGMSPSEAKLLHSRPALLQELAWRPQPLGTASHTEPAKEVVFSFFNGELYRISVTYDRRETEGLTADDLVDAISATYGTSTRPAAPAMALAPSYGEHEKLLAQWQDAQDSFSLMQGSYGPDFKLVGVLKRLEEPAQSANLEAARLDNKEAPQRQAALLAKENDAERVRLEQARLINKPKFRP
jgi:hypothetical protein